MKLQHNSEKNSWEYGNVDYLPAETPAEDNKSVEDTLAEDDTTEETEEEEEEEPEIEEETKEEDTEEEEDKEEEEGEEKEDLSEEEQDLIDAANPLSRKAIEKKFPGVFKEFPLLEKAMYAHQKYREIFPSVNDALEAQEKITNYENIEGDLNSGSFEGLLRGVQDKSPESFSRLVDNYLPELAKVNETAYYHVVGNLISHTVGQMATAAQASKDDDLLTAARILNTFAFGQAAFTPPKSFSKEKPKEVSELEKEKESYRKEKLEGNQLEVSSRVSAELEKRIDKHIDPKNSMVPYARKAAIKEAVSLTNELMKKDKPFQKALVKLWDQASKNNYSREHLLKIRTAHLNKSNALLPHVIKKVRIEALKGVGRKSADIDRQGPVTRRSNTSAGNNSSKSLGKIKKASDIPKGMSDIDFLNSDL